MRRVKKNQRDSLTIGHPIHAILYSSFSYGTFSEFYRRHLLGGMPYLPLSASMESHLNTWMKRYR
jgi:hypothetical protein